MSGILKLGRRAGYFLKGKDTIQKIVLEATCDSEDPVAESDFLTIAKLSLTPNFLVSIEKTLWKRLTHIASSPVSARKAIEVLDFILRFGAPQVHPDILRDGLAILAAASTSHVYHHDRPVMFQNEQNVREKAGATLRFVRNANLYRQSRESSMEMIERVKHFVYPAAIQAILHESEMKTPEAPPAPLAAAKSVPRLSSMQAPAPGASEDDDDELDFDPRASSSRIKAARSDVSGLPQRSSDIGFRAPPRAVSEHQLTKTTSQTSFDLFENQGPITRSESGEFQRAPQVKWTKPPPPAPPKQEQPERRRGRGMSEPAPTGWVFE
jgi:hypothetical protein